MLLYGISGPIISSGASMSSGTATGFTCTTDSCVGVGQTLILFQQLQSLLNGAIAKLGGTHQVTVNGIIDSNTVNSVIIMASTGLPQFALVDANISPSWVATNAAALVQSLSQYIGLPAGVRSLFFMRAPIVSPTMTTPSQVVPKNPSSLPPKNGTTQTQGATDSNGDICTNLAPNGFCPITDPSGITCFRSDIASNGFCFGGPSEATNLITDKNGHTCLQTDLAANGFCYGGGAPANVPPIVTAVPPSMSIFPTMSASMKLALGTLAVAGATLAGVLFYRRRAMS